MTLEEKLTKLLQTPHEDSLGNTVISFSTTKLLEQIKQIFADEGYEKRSHILDGIKGTK